ncbi:HAD family hydrolase [Luteolibacter sp. LG18]|uniref:HAD family hydrolase n=1 Tax=Luteolibacter sp. LG18 TaxID=2819286 RepID=UPI002B2D8142|nr:hypothetical protein llg_15020 [Luteolibacter sp. LG18]
MITSVSVQEDFSRPEEEAHVAGILQRLEQLRRGILARGGPDGTLLEESGCVFLTFWDFDGTILKGDCCEGLSDAGRQVYSGLLEEVILAGHAKAYPATELGVARGLADYRRLEREVGAWAAYPFLAKAMGGAREHEVVALAARHFRERQIGHVFESSARIIETLRASGVAVHVVSASPDVFIRGIVAELGLEISCCRGIRTEIHHGYLSDCLDHPVTYGAGKTAAVIEEIERARGANPGKQVFVLAAFGNSYHTDGPFLEHVAALPLPCGRPLAVMINGDLRSHVEGRSFLHVKQDLVRGTARFQG